MRALLQRASRASVSVEGTQIASIGPGLLVLLGVGHGDDEPTTDALARRTTELRIFRDDEGRTNRSIIDIGGAALVVSQFTLYADTARGRRPGFTNAAPPDLAERLYLRFANQLRANGVGDVQTGTFGAEMAVALVDDGPFTIWLDTQRSGLDAFAEASGLWSDRKEAGEMFVDRMRPGLARRLEVEGSDN